MSAPAAVLWGGPHDGREVPHIPERAARIFVTTSGEVPGHGPMVALSAAGPDALPDNPAAAVYARTARFSRVRVVIYEFVPLTCP